MKLDIYQKSGKKSAKKVTLNEAVFGITPNEHCVYLAVSSEMASIRQGTHSSKTKGEVAGSGAKPWRQKGTGRSRVGHIRNPSRVHGSKAFGPKPHTYDKKVNKKVRQLARRSVLSQKVSKKSFISKMQLGVSIYVSKYNTALLRMSISYLKFLIPLSQFCHISFFNKSFFKSTYIIIFWYISFTRNNIIN